MINNRCKTFKVFKALMKQALWRHDLTSVEDTSQPEQVCNVSMLIYNPDWLDIWNPLSYRSFCKNLNVIPVNCVMKYLVMQQIWKDILECRGFMSMSKTSVMLVTYAAGLARVNLAWGFSCVPTGDFCGIEMAVRKWQEPPHTHTHIDIYIYIYI